MECRVVDQGAPECAFGAITSVRDRIYMHGGVDAAGEAQSHLVYYDLHKGIWCNSSSQEGPRLAHHAAFISESRYINYVGGWNGTARTSQIRSFDTASDTWLPAVPCRGFPNGGGLSSHTVSALESGAALVIGRLGGLRTQRANSTVLSLRGEATKGWRFEVEEVQIASRGGHATLALSPSVVAVFGGRSDQFTGMQVRKWERKGEAQVETAIVPKWLPRLCVDHWDASLEELGEESARRGVKGRRYHAAAVVNPHQVNLQLLFPITDSQYLARLTIFGSPVVVIFHGGELFEGMMPSRRDLGSDCWLLDTSTRNPRTYKIPIKNSVALASHELIPLPSETRMKAMIAGGLADNGRSNRTLYLLSTKKNSATS